MKTWCISVGGFGGHCPGQIMDTFVHLSEMPWYVWLIDKVFGAICCTPIFWWKRTITLHDIPLPSWPSWKDEDFGPTNPANYYGDIGCAIHTSIVMPITGWCWHRTRDWSVPVQWDQIKDKLNQHDREWVEEEFIRHIQYLKEEAEEEARERAEQSGPGCNTQQPEVDS